MTIQTIATLIKATTFNGGTTPGFTKYYVIADPKRPGLLRTSLSHSVDGYKNKFSHLYGKKNQAAIQTMLDSMDKA